MSSIEVHSYVRKIELLNCISHALEVSRFSGRAFRDIKIGDKIGKTVGF